MLITIKDLGCYLKGKRMSADMTIEVLSGQLEVSKGYISRLENNSSKPSFEVLMKYSNVLGFPLEDVCSSEPVIRDGGQVNLEEVIKNRTVTVNGRVIENKEKYSLEQLLKIVEEARRIEDSELVIHLNKVLLLVDQFRKSSKYKKEW
ncbi:helix-turn-helix transcriptional regulator (plasmid) [Rossellomorea sp. AcN35-11]|nr:helix-turn-helix domain-containing protein [Rossellomorea aquimaris]WJV31970.1 helix-turn-helix transcriptional regulator [Rossellomorea sp. AcN35-11]